MRELKVLVRSSNLTASLSNTNVPCTKRKQTEGERLTRLRQGKDALRLRSVLVELLVMRDTRLRRLIGLHPVHVPQLRHRRDPRQGATRYVGRLLQAELVQDLLLDDLQTQRADLLVHPAGAAGVTGHRQVSDVRSLDAGGVEGTEEDQRE